MHKKLLLLPLFLGALLAFPGPVLAGHGFQSFTTEMTNSDGSVDTQAGSHPFELTTSFKSTTTVNPFSEVVPSADLRNIDVDLPPGLVGSATAVPPCSQELFVTGRPPTAGKDNSGPRCGNASVVGIAAVYAHLTYPDYVPIYSLAPPPGMPAEFGFNVSGTPVVLVPSLLSNEDYGLRVESIETSQGLNIYGSTVTFWGVPADPRHDEVRGSCLEQGSGLSTGESCPANVASRPLLTLPSACSGPLKTTITADSWEEPERPQELWPFSAEAFSQDGQGDPVGVDGCNQLHFNPSVAVNPDTTTADSPTGAEVTISVPQNENPEGLAESDVRKVVTTFPAGMSVSPSAANGLEACTEEQVGLHATTPAQCPNASKVGAVKVESPLLEHPLEGWAYIAQPNANPYESMFALYLVAEGSGVRLKLAGGIEPNPLTGQMTTRFEERVVGSSSSPSLPLAFPQLPFSKLKLTLFGGPRAALVTPQSCGTYAASAQLTPWSTETAVELSSPFAIDSGCASQFNPSFTAGTTSNQAGGFSPLLATFSRTDQDQDLSEVTITTPPGLLGMLSKVSRCHEPQAAQGTCPAASQIGHVTVSAGAGPDSVVLPQAGRPEDPVYLTDSYNGAPFGLTLVEHAEAGPFNLGTEIVRAAVEIDTHTAQVTVKSGPLPQIIKGVPTQVKSVTVSIDRPEFIFNPTSCNPLAATATVTSAQSARAALSSRFQAAGCQGLSFKPTFALSTQAKTSRTGGASLRVKVTSGAGQANIGAAKLDLPKQLPARLTTLQMSCVASVFDANPAGCPAASLVGHATAHSPALSVPLTGPAYLVSHGGAAFPDLVIVLQGEGVTLELDGLTAINHGITSSIFRSIPDAPISTFELTLPEGPHSVLSATLPAKAKGSLCGLNLVAPTAITGQDGAPINENTKIAVTGCPAHHKAHKASRRASHRR
jgi:hypothetical protein